MKLPFASLTARISQSGFNLPIAGGLVLIAITTLVHARWTTVGTSTLMRPAEWALAWVKCRCKSANGKATASKAPTKARWRLPAQGSFSRTYRNAHGDSVSVFLLCGRPRDMYSHSPESCYPAAGFEIMSKNSNLKIDTSAGTADFTSATFMKSTEPGTPNQRIYWSYGNDGQWEVPKDVKWAYGGMRSFFKIYVVLPVTGKTAQSENNPATDFIRTAIPELNHVLFVDPARARRPPPRRIHTR